MDVEVARGFRYGDSPPMQGTLTVAITQSGALPKVPALLFPVPASVAVQLVAYHAARTLGRPIDRPRDLAKSVTVE